MITKPCHSLSGEHIVRRGEVSDFCEVCGLIFSKRQSALKVKKKERVGSISAARKTQLREILSQNHGCICFYCGHALVTKKAWAESQWFATIDHIVPISAGGTNHIHNLVLCCKGCNQAKHNLTLAKWRDLGFPRRRDIPKGTFVPVESFGKETSD